MLSRTANSTLNEAESIEKNEWWIVSIEHLVLAILTQSKRPILKDQGNWKGLKRLMNCEKEKEWLASAEERIIL
jgi:hypothetical protein